MTEQEYLPELNDTETADRIYINAQKRLEAHNAYLLQQEAEARLDRFLHYTVMAGRAVFYGAIFFACLALIF